MANFALRPFQGSLQYQGQFAEPAFDLFRDPIPVYRNLLKFLRDYGATLEDLRYDASNLPDAHLNCYLDHLNTIIQFRLERCEATFSKYHEVGAEAAMRIGLSAWEALKASDPRVKLVRHEVTSIFHADLVKGNLEDLMKQFVIIPQAFGEKTSTGVFYYLRGRGEGEEASDILLHDSSVKEGAFYLRFHLVYDATQIALEKLQERADEFIMTRLQQLGLQVEQPT